MKLGFLQVLTLLFIALKLTDHIDWSWWWVLAPAWGGILLIIILEVAKAIIRSR